METLFREILADPPTAPSPSTATASASPMIVTSSSVSSVEGWNASGLDEDVQRLFGMIPDMSMGLEGLGLDVNMGMGVGEWNDEFAMAFSGNGGAGIGVF